MRHLTLFRRQLVLVSVAVLVFLLQAGCAGYRHGSLMHPQFNTIAVGTFKNDTEEASLTAHLRSKLAEALMNDGSVKVQSMENADAVIQGRILGFKWDRLAAVRASDIAVSNNDQKRDTYQTTIYKVEVIVEYELYIPGMRRRVLEKTKETRVIGRADYTKLPDLDVARMEALRRATADAAQQITTGITEAW